MPVCTRWGSGPSVDSDAQSAWLDLNAEVIACNSIHELDVDLAWNHFVAVHFLKNTSDTLEDNAIPFKSID